MSNNTKGFIRNNLVQILGCFCTVLYLMLIYAHLSSYIDSLYVNLVFSFIAMLISFSVGISDSTDNALYTEITLNRWLVSLCTIVIIILVVMNATADMTVTIKTLGQKVNVTYTILSDLIGAVQGALAIMAITLMFRQRKKDYSTEEVKNELEAKADGEED